MYVIFDALIFEGENPFDAGDDAACIRLNDVTEEEALVLDDIVSRSPNIGLFFYISSRE